jgi:S-adenosylmethionine:tRNA ribosyltransferase-isomerase
MRVSEFDYFLPTHLIAQEPTTERDMSNLLVLYRDTGRIEHKKFKDIIEYLQPHDLLILNDTRVIPARLYGINDTGKKFEVLLVKQIDDNSWEVLIKPNRNAKPGMILVFSEELKGKIHDVETRKDGKKTRKITFLYNGNFISILEKIGHMPLPPYIKRSDIDTDKERYQTVYGTNPGAIAAPTAGLHFTHQLLSHIRQKGVKILTLTLHVGIGTFRPIHTEDVEKHHMDAEYFSIPDDVIKHLKNPSGRIIAVGTTVTRAIETFFSTGLKAGWTDIFIYPGYRFKGITSLITNFHLPRSTPLMLVSAFAGKELLLKAYQEAIDKGYRFYSYGDAMLIL